jgi:acetolactate synthase small subunit
VLIDIPKDVQFSKGVYQTPDEVSFSHGYAPRTKGDAGKIAEAARMIAKARRPIFYTGGGVINAGPKASESLRAFAAMTGAPVTSTLMGLGAFPAADPAWLGMLGMHGTFEANHAMHDCDVMICVGARFDDRVTGRLDAFSPGSKKIHIDIDASSINKNVRVDIGIVGDAGSVLDDLIAAWKAEGLKANRNALDDWWRQIDGWRARQCLSFRTNDTTIKPQQAIDRLYALTKDRDTYITTEVGQHQMWAAQHYRFQEPNRWMTSGGLGTMGYGMPAAIGVQLAHPDSACRRHRGRSLDPDEYPGDVAPPIQYRPARQGFHHEQPVDGHGPPVAGTPAWRTLFRKLHRLAARFRETGGSLRRRRHPLQRPGRAGCEDPRDDRQPAPGGLRLPRREKRELPADDPVRQGAQRATDPQPASAYDLSHVDETENLATFALLVDNEAGVLHRVVGLFAARGYNIESLTVAETDRKAHTSRITIVTRGAPHVLDQIEAQLSKVISVRRVHDVTRDPRGIERELALVKVRGTGTDRVEALRVSDIFRAKVVDTTSESFVFEITGAPSKIDSFVDLMRPLGLVELSRTGVLSIERGAEGM